MVLPCGRLETDQRGPMHNLVRPHILCALVVALSVTEVYAQATFVHFSYETTLRDSGGNIVRTEEGAHYFAMDGRHRHERMVDDMRLVEITFPDSGERIALNYSLGLAARGPAQMRFAIPGTVRPLSGRQAGGSMVVPGPPPEGGVRAESLGTRARGPILLEGFRSVLPLSGTGTSRVTEKWDYAPVRPGPAYNVEETTEILRDDDGSRLATLSTVATSISRVPADEALFAIPESFNANMQDLWKRHRIPRERER